MVGFARCTTDYVFNGQINNVVVDVNYRGKGIGKELIKRIVTTSKEVTYILRGDIENEMLYKEIRIVTNSNLSLCYHIILMEGNSYVFRNRTPCFA